MSFVLHIIKNTWNAYQSDQPNVWCAALSYFSFFSLGPLLLLIFSIVGLLAGNHTITSTFYSHLQQTIGTTATNVTHTLVESSKNSHAGQNFFVSSVLLLFSALGIVGLIKQMFHFIWRKIAKPKQGVLALIFGTLFNMLLIGILSLFIVVSLIATFLASGAEKSLALPAWTVNMANILILLLITTVFFAILFKIMPDVKIPWKYVWIGGLFTAILFILGRLAISLYIDVIHVQSTYGAAGGLIVFLLWIYLSSHILFIGAELVKTITLDKEKNI